MKYALLLALGLMSFGSLSYAENTDASTPPSESAEVNSEDPAQALQDLCKSYIQDGTITESEYSNCLSSMTDLTESMPEPLPFADTDTTASDTATAETEPATPTDSETLVNDEIVEKPDPKAEQLNIN